MANEAYFHIKLNGTEENCKEFFNRFSRREPPVLFSRVRGAGEEMSIEQKDGETELIFDGVSAYCLLTSFSFCPVEGANKIDRFEEYTKELDLRLEAYSANDADQWFEHYVYDRGKCLVAEADSEGFDFWPF